MLLRFKKQYISLALSAWVLRNQSILTSGKGNPYILSKTRKLTIGSLSFEIADKVPVSINNEVKILSTNYIALFEIIIESFVKKK